MIGRRLRDDGPPCTPADLQARIAALVDPHTATRIRRLWWADRWKAFTRSGPNALSCRSMNRKQPRG